MSTLLEQASLVLIPSGYKEDVVYSQIPTNGNGDLSFTRASNGTRINSAGLVEVCPWNLMSYSEQFDNAFWIKATSGSATFVVTANQTTAPNGTNTADLVSITRSATSELAAIYTSVGQGIGTFKNTIWLKAKDNSNVGKTIDLWSWEGNTRGYTKITLTADWVRYEQDTTVFTGSASELMDFGLLPISYSTSTTLAVEFYAWGGQSNIGSTAKPYFPTTDRLNVPRLTYQNGGGGCPSLLLEKQSTNLVQYSEQLDNAYWNKQQVTLSANATTSPDGTQNADSVIPTTTNSGVHRFYESSSNAIATAAYSIYVKPNGYYRVALRESATTGSAIGFDLLNKTIITTYSTGGCTASGGKIEEVGNGWYRISGVFAFASAAGQSLGLYIVSPSWTSGDPEGVAWAGNGTDGLYFYGAQVEASSYPTSYIPTTSASATRVADACFKTGISSLIGQTEGTLFAQFNKPIDSSNAFRLNLSDGTTNNWVFIGFEALIFRGYIRASNSVILTNNFSGTANVNKIAIAYKSGDYAIYHNGTQIVTGSSSFTFNGTLSQINVGENPTDDNYAVGQIAEILVSKTRLTNAELASLTTI
jgi:hypothetical protein